MIRFSPHSPLPQDIRSLQRNNGARVARNEARRMVCDGTNRRHLRAKSVARFCPGQLAARDHFMPHGVGAACSFSVKFHANIFRIEIIQVDVHFKKVPAIFGLHVH